VPKPDRVNVRVHGVMVDAHYIEQRLVVELDGGNNHHSAAQMRRDHRNDLLLRNHGLHVNRYSQDLVKDEPLAVRADVLAALDARR
jgi:very-short-patch-repair endonuclease